MAKIEKFEDLECWQISRKLVKSIYALTVGNAKLARDYGLRDQIQRAAVSVMTNIAEGFARYSNREFVNFLIISRGSVAEVKSLLYVIYDMKAIDEKERESLFSEIEILRMKLNALTSHLRKTAFKK
jgi:four helix bundle protein